MASQSRPSAIGRKQADCFRILFRLAGLVRYSRRRLLSITGLTNSETKEDQKVTIAYARVSTNEQKEDLSRQIELLELFCAKNGFTYEVISDSGSGMNYRKKGLKKLFDTLLNDKVERLVITHKDRLLRFGAELVFTICELRGLRLLSSIREMKR